MAINAYLSPLTLPSGTEYPGTMQAFLSVVAAYIQVKGISDIGGVNYGATTPSEADRDKPWFKTDGALNPIGWFSWNGSAWSQILFSAPFGDSDSRPDSPVVGQLYLDTGINQLLVYERAAWRTVGGSSGEVKFVSAATIEEAISLNPGWTHFTDANGMVLAGANTTVGQTIGATEGTRTHTLTVDEIPAHSHTLAMRTDPNGGDHNDSMSDTFINTGTGQITSSVGGGTAHNNMQPTMYLWCLKKT